MDTLLTTVIHLPVQAESAAALQARVQGQVLTPGDARYEEARLAFNRALHQHPALIVIAAHAADVAEAVRFARQQGLGIAVQSTGHGVTLAADDALLVITSQLKDLRVNPAEQTARIGAGLEWGQVLVEAQKVGLAPLLGSSPNVGVVGYTLGGGLGWLGRKHGLACDSVRSFELVSAAGEVVRASVEENPELFWGLRGGGGSFGIITAMEIQLYPVEMVYAGNLLYPGEMAKQVMQRYRAWIRTAPDALTTSVVLLNFPPIPQVPEFLRGKSFVMVRGCYAGPLEEGEKLMRHWRDWKTPALDQFGPLPFTQAAKISSDPLNPAPSRSTGAWMRDLSDEAIDILIRNTLPQGLQQPALVMTEVRHAGGAVARVPAEHSAFSKRDAELLLFSVGPAPTPQAFDHLGEVMGQMQRDLQPWLTGGVYMNFLSGQEAHQRSQDGYTPAAFRRLQALKARMDPENFFRYSYDIAPGK